MKFERAQIWFERTVFSVQLAGRSGEERKTERGFSPLPHQPAAWKEGLLELYLRSLDSHRPWYKRTLASEPQNSCKTKLIAHLRLLKINQDNFSDCSLIQLMIDVEIMRWLMISEIMRKPLKINQHHLSGCSLKRLCEIFWGQKTCTKSSATEKAFLLLCKWVLWLTSGSLNANSLKI